MELSNEVAASLAKHYSSIKEGGKSIMGGQILNYPAKDILNQGIKEGIDKGEAKLSSLMSELFSQKRYEDADRATKDIAYREELYSEFGIA